MQLGFILPVNGLGCRVPSRQRCRRPRNRFSASAFAALAGRFSISAPIVIAGRSTVVKVAGNRRGATSVGKPVAAINKHSAAVWPIVADNRYIVAVEHELNTTARSLSPPPRKIK